MTRHKATMTRANCATALPPRILAALGFAIIGGLILVSCFSVFLELRDEWHAASAPTKDHPRSKNTEPGVSMTRKERAIAVRDTALKIVRSKGTWRPVHHGAGELQQILYHALVFKNGDLEIWYRTPFPKLPPPTEPMKRMAARMKTVGTNLPYGLDVYHSKNVLNIEWDGAG